MAKFYPIDAVDSYGFILWSIGLFANIGGWLFSNQDEINFIISLVLGALGIVIAVQKIIKNHKDRND